MVKVLIFDMDGTLIDTDEIIYKTWSELFLEYKPKDYVIDREVVRTFSGPPVEQSINFAFPEMDKAFVLKEYRKRTAKYYDTCLKMFPGELEIIHKLHDEGYIFAVATSKNKEMTIKCLEKYGIKDYFSYILTSSDPFKHKPDPVMLNYIINKLGVSKEEVMMIGDTKFDYLASKNAGTKCILFTGAPRKYEETIKPFAFASTYEEIYKIIKNN